MDDLSLEDANLDDVMSAGPFPLDLNFLGLDQDVVKRLSVYFESVERGNSQVYLTPMGKDHSPESILAGWDRIVQSNSHKLSKPLIDLELANRSKFGPRSIAKPWKDRRDDVSNYFSGRSEENKPFSIIKPVNSLRPVSITSGIDRLKNNTNSGLPYFTKKRIIKPYLQERFESLIKRNDPCILFTRTQEGNKTRTVWGYPIADTLLENVYYIPLLEFQRRLDWRSAIRGPEEVDKAVTRLVDFAAANGLTLVSIDFSQYDATVSNRSISRAFDYIKSQFQSKYHPEIDIIRDRFNNKPLLTPDGVIRGSHGVPSGSTFTNEVDSICQYLSASDSGCIFDGAFQIQGDDGLYACKSDKVDKLLNQFRSDGLDVNDLKTRIEKDYCIFLQCLYSSEYRQSNGIIGGIYPTYRALCRLVYQERWSDFMDFSLEGKDYYSIRAISILENVKYHPLFEELVNYIKSLDKYSLEYSQKAVAKYGDLLSNGSGTGDVIYNQYGDDVRGISSFRTVEILNR